MKAKVLFVIFILSLNSSFLWTARGEVEGIATASARDEEELIELNFPEEVDIRLLLEYVGQRTEKRFIYDERLKGSVTLRTPTKVKVGSLFALLQSILEFKGYALVSSGEWMKVEEVSGIQTRAAPLFAPEEITELPVEEAVVSQILPIRYANVTSVERALRPMLTTPGGNIITIPEHNFLIMTDYATNIRRLLKVANLLDTAEPEASIRIVPLQFALAKEVVPKVSSLIQARAAVGKRAVKPKVAPPRIDSDTRTNSIILVALPEDMEEICSLIDSLDKEVRRTESELKVYRLENTDAEQMMGTLREIIPGQSSEGTTEGATLEKIPPLKIVTEKQSNSLIITASPDHHEQIAALIERLDKRRPQVFIEAVVVEVSRGETFDLGVELATFGEDFRGVTSFKLSEIDLTTGDRTLLTLPGLTAAVLAADQVPFLLHALIDKSRAKILARPQVLANDNQEALFTSIDREPFTSTVALTASTATTSFAGFAEAGTTLKITPHISEGDYLRLDIEAMVSNFVGTSLDPTVPPAQTENKISTQVTIPDNTTVVIGGLTTTTESETVDKVPLLGDIPLLGLLFQRKVTTEDTGTLYIFITPRIFKDVDFADLKEATSEKEEELGQAEEELGYSP